MTTVHEGNGESFVSRYPGSVREFMTDFFGITSCLVFGGYIAGVLGNGLVNGLEYVFQEDSVYQQQAIGNTTPDVYIERDGVRYFSQIDGKSIESLVKSP